MPTDQALPYANKGEGVLVSKGNRTRRMALGLLPTPQPCHARNRDGTPCKASPIRGAKVCWMHGGSAPQVKDAAAQRLREGVMPMLATLYRLANDDTMPPAVQLAAVRDWLDRSGIKEAITVEVQVQPWERLVDGVLAEVPDDALRTSGVLLGRVADEPPLLTKALELPAPPPPRLPKRRRRTTNFNR